MASDCYGYMMSTPCTEGMVEADIGGYLDYHSFNHNGWSEKQCRSFANQDYTARHCRGINKPTPFTQGLVKFSKFVGGMPPKHDILAQRDLSKLIFRGDISSGEFDEDYL